MKKRVTLYLSVSLILLLQSYVFSAPLNGEPFDLEQPDGSTVPVLVWGDEFYQHIESPDGITLVRNPETGWICFAQMSSDSSELTASDQIYRFSSGLKKSAQDTVSKNKWEKHISIKKADRLRLHHNVRSYFEAASNDTVTTAPAPNNDTATVFPLPGVTPVTGSYTGLTILIDFSDKAATLSVDSIKNYVNKRGYTSYGNNGSVRDYFYDVSGGKVDYQNIVVGYYRAKNPKSYYDNSNSAFALKAQELIREALTWLKNSGFDFTQLSSDSRKQIYAINVLYAGSPAMGWSQGLWPHQGSISSFSVNGMYITKYQMSNVGTSLDISTFCHENGHLLFRWPDLYDYGGESNGIGNYCIMCYNTPKNPARPCAYLRDLSGWDNVTDITDIVNGTIFKVIPNSNVSFVYRNKSNSSEMFYIESALRTGRNKTIPDSGFMIWHVDRKGSNNYEQRTATQHYLVSLEQADNLFDMELRRNNGNRGDLFKAGYKNRFDDQAAPSAKWWNGSSSGIKIYNMSRTSDTMSFSIGDTNSIKRYQVTITTSAHGTVNPSGVIQVVAGESLRLAIKPDSGYQTDQIKINGTISTIRDTITLNNVTSNQSVEIEFALKTALLCIKPADGDLYFTGDSILIKWQQRGVTVQGISLSLSLNDGKTFMSITDAISGSDSMYYWKTGDMVSDSCRIQIADRDGTPSVISDRFAIRSKPLLFVNDQPITLLVAKGQTTTKELSIKNEGTGNLTISATSQQQIKRVLINEISSGVTTQDADAIELWNSGNDIDISGWNVSWQDNKESSGSYTFKEGSILKGGSTFTLFDLESYRSETSDYMGINVLWRTNDFLELSVSITDRTGHGVDFVRSSGSLTSPPEGSLWEGNGIELCSAFVYRKNYIDTDSSQDWACTQSGTLKQINTTLQNNAIRPYLSLTPLAGSISKNATVNFTLNIDASSYNTGTYADTILLYHNDPSRPSPQRIPCLLTVYDPSSVKYNHQVESIPKAASAALKQLFVAPNPVSVGQNVNIWYSPAGNEQYGDLSVYNSIGNRVYYKKINFKNINTAGRYPMQFSWIPENVIHGSETYFIRMNVTCKDGTRVIYSTKAGLK